MTAIEQDRHPLAASFVAAAGTENERAMTAQELARLDERLRAAWTTARKAWPGVEVPAERFAAHLGRVVDRETDPGVVLADLATDDIYLACSAASGDEKSFALIEGHAFGEVNAAGAALRAPPADVEEIKQIVRTILFVSDRDRAASIGDFAGRGSLRGWVRVIATRELLRLRRKTSRETPLEEHILNFEAHGDPEFERLKEAYRAQVADAVREAITALDVRDRLLLRYQVCDRLNIDEIGAVYQVHRATAARWLTKARAALVDLTKQRLAIRLSVDPSETDSILRLVQSQLDVSLERRLRDDS
jgi:RNA polymerase sigma-70 factor (ECF subfamily)